MKKHFLILWAVTCLFVGCEERNNPDDSKGDDFSPVFSVGVNTKVEFSSGNLQYHPQNDKWRFAENQWDYVGYGNENISNTYDGWIDLFGWGTGDNPTNMDWEYFFSDDVYFTDWGINKIGSDSPNTWRTLSQDEWDFLIDQRQSANSLKGIAQVNGVNGLIILPDNWACPNGVNFVSGTPNIPDDEDDKTYYATHQTFSQEEWRKMEEAGAIFLPAAGQRDDYDVVDVQSTGFYWSSTYCYSAPAELWFYVSGAFVNENNSGAYVGQSVRLVKDL